MATEPTVFIVDDDPAVRTSLGRLVESVGLPAQTFESAEHYLDVYDSSRPGCLVLDVRMSGMSGLNLQEELVNRHMQIPIIFITGHADVPMAVRAMAGGAVDFIEKPFRAQDLLDRVYQALQIDARAREKQAGREQMLERIGRLTRREQQVMNLVVDGKLNKQIASELNVSEKTVEVHRAHVMHKLDANNVADLVRLVVSARTILESPALPAREQ